MTEHPFLHHRQAALALLGHCSELPHKTAGFLGHVCVASELSEKQRDWLAKLLDRNDMPQLIGEVSHEHLS